MSTGQVVNGDMALELIERAIASRGKETVVTSCAIWRGEYNDELEITLKEPSCLVGQALFECVGEAEFQKAESGTVFRPAEALGVKLTKRAHEILRLAQGLQDTVVQVPNKSYAGSAKNRSWAQVWDVLNGTRQHTRYFEGFSDTKYATEDD